MRIQPITNVRFASQNAKGKNVLRQQPETNTVSKDNQSTEELRSVVESLMNIVDNMDDCDELKNKLSALEKRLTQIENNNPDRREDVK